MLAAWYLRIAWPKSFGLHPRPMKSGWLAKRCKDVSPTAYSVYSKTKKSSGIHLQDPVQVQDASH